MSRSTNTAVPKFGSFKPKSAEIACGNRIDESKHSPASRRSVNDRDRDSTEGVRGNERRSRSHDDENDRRRHRHEHQRHSKPGSIEHGDNPLPQAPSLASDEFEESNTFIVDRRGDSKNVEYGSLHRYSVPSHYRAGYGRVVGALSGLKIDRAESSDKYVVLYSVKHENRRRSGRLLSSVSGQMSSERNLRVIIPTPVERASNAAADFLRINASGGQKRKRGAHSPQYDEQARNEVNYRSIEGKASLSDHPDDDDLEYVTDSGDQLETDRLPHETCQANAELARRTRSHPTDATAWVALIQLQEKVIKPGVDAAHLTNSEKRALADVRLSIYEQALRHIDKSSVARTDLVLGIIEQGGMVWETAKLNSKWMEVLRDSPDSIKLWAKYLDFVQTNHTTFQYELCKGAYFRYLDVLHKARAGTLDNARSGVAHAQIYALSRFTAFVRDAGYDELAYSVWQALLEFHCFRPTAITHQEAGLESLEEFWDSDVPRIGEQSAQGWAHYAENHAKATRHAATDERPQLDHAQPFSSFAGGEMQLLDKLHLPVATDDDSATEDPFRYVMFSDLRQCLEPLVDEMPKRELLNAFLSFMHLPIMPTLESDAHNLQTDQFLNGVCGLSSAERSDSIGTSNQLATSFNLFHDAFVLCLKVVEAPGIVAFVDRLLQQIVFAQPVDDGLAEYYIAYKLATVPDDAVKTAKRLLKSRPSSLRLYNAYSLTEIQLGRSEKAAEAWVAALKMSSSLGEDQRDNAVLLWHSWTLTLLGENNGGVRALRTLIAMCDGNVDAVESSLKNADVSASQRLKLAHTCEAGWERMIYKKKYELAVLYAACHMWFAYLADEESSVPAIEVRRKYSARLTPHGITAADELLLQSQAGLIKRHIDRHRPYKPAVLRAELAENLRLFPDNSMLLEVYAQVGARTRIDDRIRASLQDDLLSGPKATVVAWSSAIAEELWRCTFEISGSTENSVRSTFARALLAPDSTVKHSLALWKSWFLFELPSRYDAMQPPRVLDEAQRVQALRRARTVFLDGLRYLPWCKAWIIMGLRAFARDGGMSQKDLRQVYDVLAERELRVRMPVEEMENVAGLTGA